MSKGDTVEFEVRENNRRVTYRGTYMGFNGVANIVRVKNVYYWL